MESAQSRAECTSVHQIQPTLWTLDLHVEAKILQTGPRKPCSNPTWAWIAVHGAAKNHGPVFSELSPLKEAQGRPPAGIRPLHKAHCGQALPWDPLVGRTDPHQSHAGHSLNAHLTRHGGHKAMHVRTALEKRKNVVLNDLAFLEGQDRGSGKPLGTDGPLKATIERPAERIVLKGKTRFVSGANAHANSRGEGTGRSGFHHKGPQLGG
jgi:hypothetical protein